MEIRQKVLLAPYTTFKIGGPARFFCVVKDQFDALQAYGFARDNHLKVFVLGGGSNILVSDEGFDGLVIKVENKGIEILYEDDTSVFLKIASGENWDEVVKFTVRNNWWGLENLSHIPGSAGAIAVQNVGAYGQEAGNLIKSVVVFDRETHQILELNNAQCGFGYRKSIFNSTHKGKYIIFYVTLILSKIPKPILHYRDLRNRFAGASPSIDEIRQAVIMIRNKKYPFPTEAKKGNAGSFFKNPTLDAGSFESLRRRVMANFGEQAGKRLDNSVFTEENLIKIPAAFLMDICGLKGMYCGGARINSNQPLVIINESGTATAREVLQLAEKIIKTVYEKTGVKLLIEPELVGFE